MVLCRFWAQGRCKNGDRCAFEHPRDLAPRNDNRFSALQTQDVGSNNNYGRPFIDTQPKYNLNREAIVADLSTERPQWILSAYTASPKAPVQLFGGPQREQSFEEMRLHHYSALATGNPTPAIQEAETLIRDAELQMQNAISNIDAAMDFVKKGEDEHPNRTDICEFSVKNPGQPFPVVDSAPTSVPTKTNPFGNNSSSGFPQLNSAFGQPSTMGSTPNPFGATPQNSTPFGQSAPVGAFGQPSALGQKPNPFSTSTTISSVGQANNGGGFSAFAAQSNPFGAPPQSAASNPFGQPQPPSQPNLFGQTTPASGGASFGQTSTPVNPFGAPSQVQQTSFGVQPSASSGSLGITSQPAHISPFSQAIPAATANPFAQTATPAPTTNPFGQTAMSTVPANPNPFGPPTAIAPAATTNPFGQPNITAPSSVTANPFGPGTSTSPNFNTFSPGSITAQSSENPFNKPTPVATTTTLNPFNTAAPVVQNGTAALNGGTDSNPYAPGSSFQHPPLRSYAGVDARGMLTMFKGKPVTYRKGEDGAPEAIFRNRDGTFERVFFPAGAPPYNKDTELSDDKYTEDVKAAYKHLRETRSFLGGVMPLVPPKREYCLWDL